MDVLDLGYNAFTGPLPPTLGHAASLQSVLMAGNQLSGTLPESWQSLKSVVELNLQGTQLAINAGLPSWLELSECVFFAFACACV